MVPRNHFYNSKHDKELIIAEENNWWLQKFTDRRYDFCITE
jgi:hypothetical protein